jgi:hypothetical protein
LGGDDGITEGREWVAVPGIGVLWNPEETISCLTSAAIPTHFGLGMSLNDHRTVMTSRVTREWYIQ